jgi:hypothetical protein
VATSNPDNIAFSTNHLIVNLLIINFTDRDGIKRGLNGLRIATWHSLRILS